MSCHRGLSLNHQVFQEAPSAAIPLAVLDTGDFTIADLAARSGIVPSKGEARRLLRSGGISLNGDKMENAERPITRHDLLHEKFSYLRKGRKNYVVVQWT